MLRGNYLATADEKGRVKIPADFLAELKRLGKTYYVTSATGDHARIYPMKAWEEIEKKLAKRSSYNPARQKFLAGTSRDQGRSGRAGEPDVPPSLESRAIPGAVES